MGSRRDRVASEAAEPVWPSRASRRRLSVAATLPLPLASLGPGRVPASRSRDSRTRRYIREAGVGGDLGLLADQAKHLMDAGHFREVHVGGETTSLEIGDLLGRELVIEVAGDEVGVGRLAAEVARIGQASLASHALEALHKFLGERAIGQLLADRSSLRTGSACHRATRSGSARSVASSSLRSIGPPSRGPYRNSWASYPPISAISGTRSVDPGRTFFLKKSRIASEARAVSCSPARNAGDAA